MGMKAKNAGEPQLVWRVTPENPNGELLELVPMEVPVRGSRSSRQVVWTKVPPAAPDGPLGAQPVVAPAPAPTPEAAPGLVASARSREHTASWRGSSWDLLNGLVVRDVSDRIAPRTFDALFSANDDKARRHKQR